MNPLNPTDIEFDEFCDPDNPRKIQFEDIEAAARRIHGGIIKTPCVKSHLSENLGMDLYMKLELLQVTGCFKERGARNALMMLSDEQKKIGCIAATDGNHAVAMSYHSTQLDIPCVIILPTTTPMIKRAKCSAYGAKIIYHGSIVKDAKTLAMNIRKDKGLLYINGYDHPNVIEGQGTIGIEIIEQIPDVDAVLIPVGGGGLLTGTAVALKHLKPEVEIYGIETDKTCSMIDALKKNERVYKDIPTTIADGLRVYQAGVNTFFNVRGLVDKVVAVKEDWISRAIMRLADDERLIVEGAGAAGVAAIMAGLLPNLKNKKVVCILTGGNIDLSLFAHCIERAMTLEGRLVDFKVTVHNRPTGIATIVALLAEIGVTIRDCTPEMPWVKGDVFSLDLKFVVETKGWDHTKQMIELIKSHYSEYFFNDMKIRQDKRTGVVRGPCLAPKPVCMQKK